MLENILTYCLRHRWLMLAIVVGTSVLGVYNYDRLPIDAVPDITNVQVQINTSVPSLKRMSRGIQSSYTVAFASGA